MKKLLILLAATSIGLTAFSQTKKPAAKPAPKDVYTIYTIKNGVKTKVGSSSKITIPVGPDGKHTLNIAVEFDVQALHKKYPYDLVQVFVYNYTEDNSYSNTRGLSFVDPGEAKLLAQTPIKKFTLYPEAGAEFKDYTPLFNTSNSISTDWLGDSMALVIRGAYSSGTETYYDDYSNSVKTRHNFTQFVEISPVPTVLFQYDKTYLNSVLNDELRGKINANYDNFTLRHGRGNDVLTLTGLAKKWLEGAQYSTNSADMLATKNFIINYFNARLAEFEKMEDHAGYVEKLSELIKEITFLNLSNLNTDQKKTLDKLIKRSRTATNDEIVGFFKAANPSPPAPLVDYASYIAR